MRTAPEHRNFIVTVLGLLFFTGPASSSPIIAPFAETRSAFTITAEFDQTSFYPYFAPSPTTTTNTRTLSTAFSTYPKSGHVSSATSKISASSPDIPEPIENVVFNFNSIQSSRAMALTPEPSFAKSVSLSRGGAYGIIIPDKKLPTEPQPSLTLTWDLFELSMLRESKSAFSMMRHSVAFTERRYGETNPTTNTLGFTLMMTNEHQAITPFNANSEALFYDWFEDNIEFSPGVVQLVDNPTPLSAEISLADSLFSDVSVTVDHLEYSAEAPPGATSQVAEKAGFIARGDSAPLVRWNKNLSKLSFDPFDANVLSNRRANEVHPKYANDPLIGGKLEIDPLFLVGEYNNRLYFSGEEARLIDNEGNIRFRANLPSVAFEEDLASNQDFNLFAPILDILDLSSGGSKWLQDFQERAAFDSPHLPELFVALDLDETNSSIWEDDFEVSAEAVISFAGLPLTLADLNTVPEPNVVNLVAVGYFAWLIIPYIRRRVPQTGISKTKQGIKAL